MADELLPGLFSDNPAYQQAWQNAQQPMTTVTPEQLIAAKSEADSAFDNLSVAPQPSVARTIAASIGASLPALFGGITGGWEGAGYGGAGASSAMQNFQRTEEATMKREQDSSRVAAEKKQRGYETLLALAERAAEKKGGLEAELLIAGGKDISDTNQAKLKADADRELEMTRFDNDKELESIKTTNKGLVTEAMAESLKAQGEKLGVKIEVLPGEPIEVGKVVLDQLELRRKELADEGINTDREADNSRETLKALMGDEAKEAQRETTLKGIEMRGDQTRQTLATKKELAKMGAVARAVVGRIQMGEDPTPEDMAGITDPNDMKIVMSYWRDKDKSRQANVKLAQGDRRLDIQDKSVTGTLADKEVGRELQARDLNLKEANQVWTQAFKTKQLEVQQEYQNEQIGIQKMRAVAQANAQALRDRKFEAQSIPPEAISDAQAAMAELGASPKQLEMLSHERNQQGLGMAVGEIRRAIQYKTQANGLTKKPLPAKAVDAYAAANTVQDVLANAYKIIDKLEKDSMGNRYATYTAQKLESLIPVSDAAQAKSWLTMDGMRLLYTQSGKQINETEAKLFTDFFAGAAPIAIGDLRARFDELAMSSLTTAVANLEAAELYGGTRASAKVLAKRLIKRIPPKIAAEAVKLRPSLFTEGDE